MKDLLTVLLLLMWQKHKQRSEERRMRKQMEELKREWQRPKPKLTLVK